MHAIDKLFQQEEAAYALRTYLDGFRVKSQSPLKINARCPICHDSKKSKSKTRFWVYHSEKRNGLSAHCYNCFYSDSFTNFLKDYYPDLYSEYIFSRYKPKKRNVSLKQHNNPLEEREKKREGSPIASLLKAETVPAGINFLKERKIPLEKYDRFYYTSNFYKYVNSIVPDTFDEKALKYDHPRIIIPFFDMMGKCFGLQGRSIKESNAKYITILFDKQEKIYGLDNIDFNKKIYCFEGPIDSLFIPNSIAMAGADATPDKEAIIVLDNEPRNKEILSRYDKYITRGYNICIWPKDITEKDINDMILAGYTPDSIVNIIDKNTYKGAVAKLKLSNWRKI